MGKTLKDIFEETSEALERYWGRLSNVTSDDFFHAQESKAQSMFFETLWENGVIEAAGKLGLCLYPGSTYKSPVMVTSAHAAPTSLNKNTGLNFEYIRKELPSGPRTTSPIITGILPRITSKGILSEADLEMDFEAVLEKINKVFELESGEESKKNFVAEARAGIAKYFGQNIWVVARERLYNRNGRPYSGKKFVATEMTLCGISTQMFGFGNNVEFELEISAFTKDHWSEKLRIDDVFFSQATAEMEVEKRNGAEEK